MKYCLTLAFLLLSAAASATTLHLPGDIALLVLDGKRVSSSLVRGAEQIELNTGVHQIVLQVEKSIPRGDIPLHYLSAPLIITFSTEATRHVTIQPPAINNVEDAKFFDTHPLITLRNEHGQVLPVISDVLHVDSALPANKINYEQLTREYNLSGQKAALPRFTQSSAPATQGGRFSWLRPDRLRQVVQ
ncbi:DUF2057 domain-containing protein [Shimwellia pseudoproteus]|uniref:DUF2057 family protein n=1 Tax=Shimwellia pseudoproteus TaxID=570012 RepID=UPI0018EB585E|nr:DUF2057 family protein [Shimwellia pseudoproteus]MBJ3815300.1 DUF2057 domain-containing protein [Shimwellia pseudoproteus]